MTVKERLGIKIGDLILMAGIILLALLLFLIPLLSRTSTTAEITLAETGEVRMLSLSRDGSYEVTSRGVHLTVCVEDGELFVSHSDCRDGICRATPPISRAGQSIICAPAGVVIRILGEEVIVDGVSG